MGGGDNELVIKSILDNTGFTKGSKQLMSAVKSLSNSVKSMFGRIAGAASIFGVLSKAVSTFMSQNQALTKQMNAAWTALGNALGPIITMVVNWVTKAVSYLVTLMNMLGLTSKTASQASKAAQSAAGGLQRTLAGFDELNKLSSGGGSGAGTLQDVDPTVWMDKFVEAIKSKMWDVAANLLIEKFNGIIEKVRSKAEELGNKIGEYLGGIAQIVAKVIKEVNWSGIGEAIASFLNGILNNDNLNGEDLGTILVGKFVIALGVLTGFLETLDWSTLADVLSDIVIGALESLTGAIEKADWQDIGDGIRDFFLKLWDKKDEIAEAIFGLLRAAWNAALDLLWGLIAGDSEVEPPIVSSLRSFGEALIEFVEKLSEFVSSLQPLWDWIYTNIIEPVARGVLDDARRVIQSLTDSLDALIKLIHGDISFGEFVKEVDGVTVAIAGLAAAIGASKFISWLGGIAAPAAGATGSVSTLAAAFGTLASVMGVGGALATAGVAAAGVLALVDEVVTVNKIGYAEAGLSAEEYAQNLVNLTAEAEKTQEEFDELAQYSSELTMEQNKLDHANIAVNNAMIQLADSLGLTTDELKAQIEAANGNIMQIEALKQHTGEAAAAAQEAAEFNNQATNDMAEGYENLAENVEASTQNISSSTETNTQQAADALGSATSQMTDSVESDFAEMEGEVSSTMQNIQSEVSNGFASVVSSAYGWGVDLIVNFNNGLVNAVNNVLESTLQNIAQAIRNYIGFSEPKKGPLSDFHTYGPDMMQLYAQGIDSSKSRVLSAVNDVAEGVAEGLNATPLSMSAVASGSVVPYSVVGSSSTNSGGNADVAPLIEELRGLVVDFRNSVENMQWVAQFGDMRALVQRITTIQKQIERANG